VSSVAANIASEWTAAPYNALPTTILAVAVLPGMVTVPSSPHLPYTVQTELTVLTSTHSAGALAALPHSLLEGVVVVPAELLAHPALVPFELWGSV